MAVRTAIWTTVGSPLGELLLVGEESAEARGGVALVSLSVPGQKGGVSAEDAAAGGWRRDPAVFTWITDQLRAYFAGASTRFEIDYAGGGTDFQRRVWAALDGLPYGATVSYGEIAGRIGLSGTGVRAVGTAIGRNPLLVVRPCHRVIGADGALRGYAGGLERKQWLLGLEGVPAS
ncbi:MULTISPECIES: methylated-DNA--[protein]-cysteine S-methyltransferase [unclassified Streptomyces]|uniref:methylated-DNA--[protein]-cysteine S-methyltransferase n=1 Tax=unclassified Streptomyces TaxID=2593676 RepID=UPI002E15BF94|nr:methylated-DNA--[protein]-cysteine S-methyltransferase [Streptomyces sp. NBC_01197]WSS51016.1 methylated-DNA--[protein]-cysteine S-methyltransferase [Streptomyces sp. NBC_01180]